MEYKIGVRDRLVLLAILPETGNLTTIKIVRELREALSFNETEHADLQMKQDGERLTWEEGAIPARTVEVGAKGQEIIRDALGKLDKDATMTADHLDLCDMFEYEGE